MPLQCPPLDPALVEWLDQIYPERSPRRGTPVETLWFEAGAREVVRNLITELERQQTIHVHEGPEAAQALSAPQASADPRGRAKGSRT